MHQDPVSKEINNAICKGIFPGAVLLSAVGNKIIFHQAYGMANIYSRRKMQNNSIFDLASLTKPLATTLAMIKLIELKLVSLDQTLGNVLKAFRHTDKKDITIDMLLRHTSGLPAYREYYKKIIQSSHDPRLHLRQLLVKEPLDYKIGEKQEYSDLGFMILSWIIETMTGQQLDRFVSRQIYSPLKIDDLFFLKVRPAHEKENRVRKRMVATQKCPWRKKVLVGEVDDDNAWAVGGVDGHAGLFGDANAIYKLCIEILKALQGRPSIVLEHTILKAFIKRKDHHEMVAGFDTPAKKGSSSGSYFSKKSIGHLGFTGTSFWIDPETSVIIVFLTNRVHPFRENQGIKKIRPIIHDLVYTQLIENI